MPNQVLRQRDWTDDELQASGFQHFEPIKRLVMAKVLQDIENVEITLEILMSGS